MRHNPKCQNAMTNAMLCSINLRDRTPPLIAVAESKCPYIYKYTHINIYKNTYIHTHIYIYTDIHMYIYTYIHTCIHTYIHSFLPSIHPFIHSFIQTYIHILCMSLGTKPYECKCMLSTCNVPLKGGWAGFVTFLTFESHGRSDL